MHPGDEFVRQARMVIILSRIDQALDEGDRYQFDTLAALLRVLKEE